MSRFLSCDWGTTSFRLRLIEKDSLRVIGEVKTDQGIAATFKHWERQGGHRKAFYAGIIFQNRLKLSEQLGERLDNIPVVLSGMASSTIGMEDMPYKLLPFNLDGSNLQAKLLVMDKTPFIIISGACTANDVMRGEETKLIGCAMALPKTVNEKLVLMPGTHPKHIFVKGDQAIAFKTFMTGEFFDLLSRQSVLAASVSINIDLASAENSDSFIDGVKAGQTTNLLHAAFMVRTNQVLKKMPAQETYHYLSGLLIGAELKDIKVGTSVYLVGGPLHLALYTLACEIVGLSVLKKIDADDALIKGQSLILKKWVS